MKTKFAIVCFSLLAGAFVFLRSLQPEKAPPSSAGPAAVGPTPSLVAHLRPPKQPSLRLAAPELVLTPDSTNSVTEDTNKVARLMAHLASRGPDQLSLEQVDGYLAANQRNATSLLAAYRTTGDEALLQEALEKFPNDPQVNFTALFQADTPEKRLAQAEALKKSDPDNAMANYLAAQEYFKADNRDLALHELLATSEKTGWRDYSLEFIQSTEEAYRAAGYSHAEAKAMAVAGLPIPHIDSLGELGRNINDLALLYQEQGDADSALAARQLGLDLGRRIETSTGGNSVLINYSVGLNIQARIFAAMNPAQVVDANGRTVQDELNAIKQSRSAIGDLAKQSENIFPTLSEQDLAHYIDRQKTFGVVAAIQWLIESERNSTEATKGN